MGKLCNRERKIPDTRTDGTNGGHGMQVGEVADLLKNDSVAGTVPRDKGEGQ